MADEWQQITQWLTGLEYQQYIPVFEDNGYDDWEIIKDLTLDDLINENISKEHAKKILKHIPNNRSNQSISNCHNLAQMNFNMNRNNLMQLQQAQHVQQSQFVQAQQLQQKQYDSNIQNQTQNNNNNNNNSVVNAETSQIPLQQNQNQQQHVTHIVFKMSQITAQLQTTQAQLRHIIPQLTSLQTQLQTPSQSQNTKALETHYRAVYNIYEQDYRKCLLYSQQIQQLRQYLQQHQQHQQSIVHSQQTVQQHTDPNYRKFDFKIDNNDKCFGNDETHFSIEDCSALYRLIQALQYYSTMNSNQEEFTDFCVNNYKNALNDHIHFMTTHSKQVEQINNILIQKDDF
eukprot:151687_1